MMCLDIYLNGLNSEEYNKIKKEIKTPDVIPPLLCWEFFPHAHRLRKKEAKIQTDIHSLEKLSSKYTWNINLDQILNENTYDALVVTDINNRIIWVNNGFYEMTGYSKTEIIDKTPVLLQGEETSKRTKKIIRDHLRNKIPVKEILINYRKDGSLYKCELNIFPLNGSGSVHFLALEREV